RTLRVFTCGASQALLDAARTGAQRQQIRAAVLARESAYFPGLRAVYLATSSLNHVAEEAGHFVRHCAVGGSLDLPRTGPSAFYPRCFEEALAFFASRRVNPARPCPQAADWAALLRRGDPLAHAAAFVLAHRTAERHSPRAATRFIPPNVPELFHAVS